jgi:hypothetical protein
VARDSKAERHRRLLEETNRGYAALRADPEAWRAELAERSIWDAALQDGLDPQEVWTEDREVRAATGARGG